VDHYEWTAPSRHGREHMVAILVSIRKQRTFLSPLVEGALHPTYTRGGTTVALQGYLAHKKTPTPLGHPKDPRHRLTVGS